MYSKVYGLEQFNSGYRQALSERYNRQILLVNCSRGRSKFSGTRPLKSEQFSRYLTVSSAFVLIVFSFEKICTLIKAGSCCYNNNSLIKGYVLAPAVKVK